MTLPYTYPRVRRKPTRRLIATYVEEFERSHGRKPTATEIASAFGMARNHVYKHLRRREGENQQ